MGAVGLLRLDSGRDECWRRRVVDARIDETAIASQKTIHTRVAIVLLLSALIGFKIGLGEASVWFALVTCAEFWNWLKSSALTRPSSGSRQRAAYLMSTLGLTLCWTGLPMLFLASGHPGVSPFGTALSVVTAYSCAGVFLPLADSACNQGQYTSDHSADRTLDWDFDLQRR